MKTCRDCGKKIGCKKRAICWRCYKLKYNPPLRGHRVPHHCSYCGKVGHNILTCKKRIRQNHLTTVKP